MRPHKVIFNRPQHQRRSRSSKNIAYHFQFPSPPIIRKVRSYKRPATTQSHRSHRHKISTQQMKMRIPLHKLSSRPRSSQNFHEWTKLMDNKDLINEEQVLGRADEHLKQTQKYKVSSRLQPNTPNTPCYCEFRVRNSSQMRVNKQVKIIWPMPIRLVHKRTKQDRNSDVMRSEIMRKDTSFKVHQSKQHIQIQKDTSTVINNAQKAQNIVNVKERERWIILKQPLPFHYDTVLCSEKDVKDFITSCCNCKNDQIMAINLGKNLYSRFAHIRVRYNPKHIIAKHRTTLGRHMGKWANVQIRVLKVNNEPNFSLFNVGTAVTYKLKRSNNQ